ncbi:MAG: Cna B-type domain-containing protein [Clostridia bacterium]|nr:Cna B-type domain-containing protein [Clostridia bacterium]
MIKRIVIAALVLLLMLSAILPVSLAAPSEAGCSKSPTGKHSWGARPRNAWCDYAGGYVWSCGYCGKHVFEETTPALGHDWPAWTQTKDPTCTEKGSRTRTCKRCKKVETQEIAARGHYYPNPWTTVKEATCEEAGQEVNYCVRCNYEWRRELEATGHDWNEGVVTKEPTAYEEGEMTYTCKNDPSHTKTEPIPATAGLTSSTVKIVWDDDNDAAGLRPSEVKADFTQKTHWTEGTTTVVTLNSGNGWTFTMSGLHEKDEAGNYFEYTWAEHTDDLPEGYQLISKDVSNEVTVFTNSYYDSSTDPSPSLKLSISGEYKLKSYNVDNFGGADVDIGIDAFIGMQLTNTGNVPLYTQGRMKYDETEKGSIWQYAGHDSSDLVLTAGTNINDTNSFSIRHANDYYAEDTDYTTQTPDDPVNEAKVTITFWYLGYDPAEVMKSGIDGIEPLCQSNACTFTVYIPREGIEEKKPVLDVVKTVANQPKDFEYFHEGEEVKWGLNVTNTSEDPIMEVTVDDKGTTVGSFDSMEPGETLPCEVPSETVTEYEAKVVGYITNYATASGKDAEGGEHSWPGNVATAPTKKLSDEDDPLGPIYGLKVAASITKEEAHGPLNGKYYDLNETIDYVITVKNTGEETLKDVKVTDSLNGDTPIGTVDSLAPGEEKEFTFSYMVTQDDIDHHWVVNMALLNYTFGENIGGTPRSSDKVYSKAGEGDGPVDHFDPEKLPKDEDYCSLTLDALGDTEARYTLHFCEYDLTTLADAEASAAENDWDEAAEIWYSAILELYGILYEAGDSEAKAAVTEDRALFMAYAEKYASAVKAGDAESMKQNTLTMYEMLLTTAKNDSRRNELIAERDALLSDIEAYGEGVRGEALTKMLRLKCAQLCYSVHTMPEQPQSSLISGYEALAETEPRGMSTREFDALSGSDCAVTEYYDVPAARAMQDVLSMLRETGYGSLDSIFLRGQSFWQAALDEEVKPLYLEADENRKQDIGAWRVTLDSLLPGERSLLMLMYPEAPEIPEELLMDLYRDAVLFTEHVR